MSRAVTPAGRRRDRIAIGLVLAGVLLAAVPALRLSEMGAGRGMIQEGSRVPRNMERANRLVLYSTLGGALVLVGVAMSVWSFARHHSSRPDRAHDAEADHS